MIKRPGPIKVTPENVISKWYSNLLGNPNHYSFILDAKVSTDKPAGEASLKKFIKIKQLYLRRTGLALHEDDNYETHFLERPLYGETYLEQLNKRLMKAIFKYLKR